MFLHTCSMLENFIVVIGSNSFQISLKTFQVQPLSALMKDLYFTRKVVTINSSALYPSIGRSNSFYTLYTGNKCFCTWWTFWHARRDSLFLKRTDIVPQKNRKHSPLVQSKTFFTIIISDLDLMHPRLDPLPPTWQGVNPLDLVV